MTENDKNEIHIMLRTDNFDYFFRTYSLKIIKDKQFHKLRRKYKKAANKLKNYIKPIEH